MGDAVQSDPKGGFNTRLAAWPAIIPEIKKARADYRSALQRLPWWAAPDRDTRSGCREG